MLIAKFQTKAFLLRYNGGYTPKIKFKAKGISSDIRGFYGGGAAVNSTKFSCDTLPHMSINTGVIFSHI